MIGRRCALIALGGLLVLVLTVNIYFVRMIIEDSPHKRNTKYPENSDINKIQEQGAVVTKMKINKGSNVRTSSINAEKRIKLQMRTLPSKYFKPNANHTLLLDRLLAELKIVPNVQEDIWVIPQRNWPDADHLIPPTAPELGTILHALRTSKITKAENALLGTQLKLMLTLNHGVKALFKPMWYNRDTLIKGPVYHGKDRHNAEVVAFHLSSLLSFRRVPICVIRKLKLSEEIRKQASTELLNTMYQEGNNICFYGICHYCSPEDPICGIDDLLEGVLILWLPNDFQLSKHRNPWQRTYKKNKAAAWEMDDNYCDKVKGTKTYSVKTSSRLLDLVDTAIFDFLMDNGDRHHYELVEANIHNPAVLLIDNGKSLGDPDVDHFDILAPLYQCCLIHNTTWNRLKLLSGGALSKSLRQLLEHEARLASVSLLITDAHLNAMDRRLLAVFATVEHCLKQNKYPSSVILDHR
ncbi:glycosaminoglycan xylosylkinase [Neodiprion lecontei]|uniref:Glycosaminoglycan xylosylkinase n=1 Tax=Neodiprion lecontei TaxID=441921 RepID=A0A6J0C1C6_NEOLC|nr:glycosaminoglycan xylosylkinase [Neodiprion lecontei]XP_046586761.1 glycosaminoglycan xylosylkinase [Neodiprion lecontei]